MDWPYILNMLVYHVPIPPYETWRAEAVLRPSPLWAKLDTQPPEGMHSIRLFVQPYRPYALVLDEPTISAFYIASQELYHWVKQNCTHPAFSLPLKPLIAGFGIGQRGRNGLISIEGIGSWFAAEAAWSEEEAPLRSWTEKAPLAAECSNCDACMQRCPAAALDGSGRVDVKICLRALAASNANVMSEQAMASNGASIWGCDFCQAVCPRNAGIDAVPMPENVREAIAIRKLLAGNIKDLAPLIGTNYARKARMRIRACIVAGCLEKQDALPQICELFDDPLVGPYAHWAKRTLDAKNRQ